jgi:enamine deaminase RidA (YjgF/YER057c/UK114 family)
MSIEVIQPKSVHDTTAFSYSHAVKMGGLIFVAGQVALDASGNLVGEGDVAAQTEQVFHNLKTVLEAAGSGLDKVGKVTVLTTKLEYRPTIHGIRSRVFKEVGLVERHTRYVMLARVKAKDTETVINALIEQAHTLPRELYQSLTWDRGKEMADHKRFTLATDIKVYFCDPHHPWQRGSNENTNGLLRQYFPKGMDLSNVHQNRLNAVARRLNERPRETLNFETPAERFSQCVASIG